MRRLELDGAVAYALTDCAPAPADWAYAFPEADAASRPELRARWFPDRRFHTRFGVFVLRIGAATVLVDCGLGPGPVAYFPGMAGSLPSALAEIGVGIDDVSHVVLTHLHVDHVGWVVDAEGRKVFRNARHVAAEPEWRHWSMRGEKAGGAHHVQAVQRAIAPLAAELDLLRGGDAIVPGVSLLDAPGHTPGHHAVLYENGASRLLIAGDLWHSPAQVSASDWCHRADMDKKMAIATRRRIGDWALRTGAAVGAGHFPEACAFGRITPDGFVPVP